MFQSVAIYANLPQFAPASPAPGPFAHELGHGLYGFCHLRQDTGASYVSVMGWFNNEGRLSESDAAAVRAVYTAGLTAGSRRPQLVAAGPINP